VIIVAVIDTVGALLTMMKNDDVIIVKHGKEYDEEAEYLDKYPIVICPECMSTATYIVGPNVTDRALFRGYVTGEYRYHKESIFIKKQVNVNYRCNSCKCAFRKWYDVKGGMTRVSGIDSAIIITGLIFVFSVVAAIFAKEAEEGVLLSNGGYYPDGFMFWIAGSIIVAIVSFITFCILWGED
jgi:hypothetical protein